MCAGAKIMGDTKTGNNMWINVNAVIIHDVPDNCTAVGFLTRIIPH